MQWCIHAARCDTRTRDARLDTQRRGDWLLLGGFIGDCFALAAYAKCGDGGICVDAGCTAGVGAGGDASEATGGSVGSGSTVLVSSAASDVAEEAVLAAVAVTVAVVVEANRGCSTFAL